MYICNACESEFEEPRVTTIREVVDGIEETFDLDVCPECGSEDFDGFDADDGEDQRYDSLADNDDGWTE